ncbi:hypothetical protein GCM10027578_16910 [Spirosoma luteolum]
MSADGRGYLDSEEKAVAMVNGLLADISRYGRFRFNETIQVRETSCAVPSALICGVRLNGRLLRRERLISYNNTYLRRISKQKGPATWIDWHVLAHEIGHHVLGHLDGGSPILPIDRLYRQETDSKKQVRKSSAIDGLQAREFEADFFGLWLLSRTSERFSFPAFINSFDTTYIQTAGADPYLGGMKDTGPHTARRAPAESAAHPFFSDRIWAMTRFWQKLHTERSTLAKASYFSDAASAAYVERHPERLFWDVGVVGGLTVVGKPAFSVDGMPVGGLLYTMPQALNWYGGLSVRRFRWFTPWQYEAELAYSTQRYGTTVWDGKVTRLLESLTVRWLTLAPKLTWQSGASRINRLLAHQVSGFVSVGPMLRWPLGLSYQNYAAGALTTTLPQVLPSLQPRVSVGVALLKETIRPRAVRLALSYEPTWIRFDATPRPTVVSHNLDLTLTSALARW